MKKVNKQSGRCLLAVYSISVNVSVVNEVAHKKAHSVPETETKIRMRTVTQKTSCAISFNYMLPAGLLSGRRTVNGIPKKTFLAGSVWRRLNFFEGEVLKIIVLCRDSYMFGAINWNYGSKVCKAIHLYYTGIVGTLKM